MSTSSGSVEGSVLVVDGMEAMVGFDTMGEGAVRANG